MVVEPSRGRHDDLHAALERLDLGPHADTADHDGAAQVASVGESFHLGADLQRQLARRRQHQGARAVLSLEPVEQRQDECQRLPRARRGGTDHVLPLQGRGDRLRLDGRRRFEAGPPERREGFLGKSKLRERHESPPAREEGGALYTHRRATSRVSGDGSIPVMLPQFLVDYSTLHRRS